MCSAAYSPAGDKPESPRPIRTIPSAQLRLGEPAAIDLGGYFLHPIASTRTFAAVSSSPTTVLPEISGDTLMLEV